MIAAGSALTARDALKADSSTPDSTASLTRINNKSPGVLRSPGLLIKRQQAKANRAGDVESVNPSCVHEPHAYRSAWSTNHYGPITSERRADRHHC